MKYLVTALFPSSISPALLLLPYLVKSTFKAPVPEYSKLSLLALSVQNSLNESSRSRGSSSNGSPFGLCMMPAYWQTPTLWSWDSKIFLAKTLWTTFVLSKQSMQFVLNTPVWVCRTMTFGTSASSFWLVLLTVLLTLYWPYLYFWIESRASFTNLDRWCHCIFLHSAWKSNQVYLIWGSFSVFTISVKNSPMIFWEPFLSIRLIRWFSP